MAIDSSGQEPRKRDRSLALKKRGQELPEDAIREKNHGSRSVRRMEGQSDMTCIRPTRDKSSGGTCLSV